MDGDITPLDSLLELRDRYANTILMVDEAHSLGVLGARGRGIEEYFDCQGQVDVLMGTLSKTIPCQGGYVTGSKDLVTFLRYNARAFVFSAALSPVSAAAAHAALEVLELEGEERSCRLRRNASYFPRRLVEAGFDIGKTRTAIVPILLGSESLAFEMARLANDDGLYVLPVTYPAVPRGSARLRMSVNSGHSEDELERAVRTLERAATVIRESASRGLGGSSVVVGRRDLLRKAY
jgi:7-keto-8-aminopelargonate synthetase-like enzyme